MNARMATHIGWRAKHPARALEHASGTPGVTASVKSSLRGIMLRPMPWVSRRAAQLVRIRTRRVILFALGICLVSGFDLAFTILACRQGILDEYNPVARFVLQHGTAWLILYKMGLVAVGCAIIAWFRRAAIAEVAAFFVWATYVTLGVWWSEWYRFFDLHTGALLPYP